MHSGHVFVIRGDLTALACDAWLLPTDEAFRVEPIWPHDPDAVMHARARGWADGERVQLLDPGSPADWAPAVWLGNIGADYQDAAWYAEGAAAFVRAAASACTPPTGRAPLLGLPHVGTGAGGAETTKGDVLEALFATLYAVLAEDGIEADVVVVSWDAPGHAAAQRARARALGGSESKLGPVIASWPFADDTRAEVLGQHAERLAHHARTGDLALFMGAGVSAGAGLPSWAELLEHLAGGLDDEIQESTVADLARLRDPRDQAELLRLRFEAGRKDLGAQLQRYFSTRERYSLQHGLLSSLPAREFITTNFDELFETAARAGRRDLRVIGTPGDPGDAEAQRWLLKLHGTVSDPTSIVLTRSSFFEAPRQRGALLGLVQAMLMTRHMLFVGYGLGDEDFHELVHEVRLARAPAFRVSGDVRPDPQTFGSAITLFQDDVHAEIWARDIEVVAMSAPADDPSVDAINAGREAELFLDLLGLLAADRTAFILDPQYAGMLTSDEQQLAMTLTGLAVAEDTRDHDGWRDVHALLERFGDPRERKE